MKLGKIKLFVIILTISLSSALKAEDKILSAPIINLENLEPSYEELENEKDTISNSNTIKKYNWQKTHTQNLSGSDKAYKPNKISKNNRFKNYETWKN